METKSEKFEKTFAETWAEWVEKGKAGERQVCFPAEVIDSLKKLGPPSWDQVDAAIEKLLKEERLVAVLARTCRIFLFNSHGRPSGRTNGRRSPTACRSLPEPVDEGRRCRIGRASRARRSAASFRPSPCRTPAPARSAGTGRSA